MHIAISLSLCLSLSLYIYIYICKAPAGASGARTRMGDPTGPSIGPHIARGFPRLEDHQRAQG